MVTGIITFQLDEGELLRSWISFHASIFGHRNIIVVDNGSKDRLTVEVLRVAESKGVRVFNFEGNHNFEQKGNLVSGVARGFQKEFPFYLPLDTDEFVCVREFKSIKNHANGTTEQMASYSSSRSNILQEIRRTSKTGRQAGRISTYINNIPGTRFGYETKNIRKLLVKNNSDLVLDTGFHQIRGIPEEYLDNSNLALMHFHNRDWIAIRQRARLKLASRVEAFTVENLETLKKSKGKGHHLVDLFFLTREEYMQRFPKPTLNLEPLMRKHNLIVPFSELPEYSTEELEIEKSISSDFGD